MRAGVFLAYWPWFTPAEQVELAVLADRLGLDSAWVAEAWGQDAVSVLGLLAGKTQRIGLGSGLMQIPARKPTATAMAAASLDVLSDGRFRLGLGLSGPQVSEGWYGVPFTRNLGRTREYVDTVRRVLARERVALPLEGAGLPGADPGLGLGKPLKLLTRPVQDRLPIYLGAIGPKAVRQTGAIADGWLPFMLDPTEPETLLGPLREGAEAAGRTLADIDIAPVVPVAIDEDLDAARDAVRPWLAFYLGSMGAKSKNFYVELAERQGHGAAAREVQDRALAGDRVGAVAAVTDGLVDAGAIATTPTGLDARLAAYERAGVNTLVAVPCGEDRPGVLRALAAATETL
jgi:F420-dependent oxidoreductase-like protein